MKEINSITFHGYINGISETEWTAVLSSDKFPDLDATFPKEMLRRGQKRYIQLGRHFICEVSRNKKEIYRLKFFDQRWTQEELDAAKKQAAEYMKLFEKVL